MNYYFKPKNSWLRGTEISTLRPDHKKLFFLSPRLGAAGAKAKAAQEAYSIYEKNKKRYDELTKKIDKSEEEIKECEKLQSETTQEKSQDLIISLCVESIKQQYDLVGSEKLPQDEAEVEKLWKDTFCDYFCEDDLLRIVVSMRMGKEMQVAEIFTFAKENAEKLNPQ